MLKNAIAPLLLCAAFAGFSTQANAFSASMKTLVSNNLTSGSCHYMTNFNTGFIGNYYARVKTYSDGSKTFQVFNVIIKKIGTQPGGNKANLEAVMMSVAGQPFVTKVKSGDNLKQDGSSNALDLQLSGRNVAAISVRFIFDKPSVDPHCDTYVSL